MAKMSFSLNKVLCVGPCSLLHHSTMCHLNCNPMNGIETKPEKTIQSRKYDYNSKHKYS